MDSATVQTTAEDDVRALISEWVRAARTKDLDAIMATYTPDIVAFDAIMQLQFKGAETYRKHWETCLSFMPGPMVFDVHELAVAVDGDVAFAHYLCLCGGTKEDGTKETGWMRGTVCCRRSNDRWRIAHEHFSAPFDPESGKALFDLKP